MQNNHETYTYTARNANNPNKVVTFTLLNGHMQVNLTGMLDQASAVSDAEEKSEELKQQITAQAKPVAMKLTERVSGPVHVSDVQATLSSDEHLKVNLWQRLGGLRFAPVTFNLGKIDNKDAADAFVKELEQRQEEESHAGKFSGFLDYWIGWIGLLVLIAVLIRRPKRN